MLRRFAIVGGAIALWALSPAAALAFEQTPLAAPTPVAPPKAAPAPAPAGPALSLESKSDQSAPESKGRELKLPGIGSVSIPKLNFGLDLMYGSPDSRDTELGFTPQDPAPGGDVTIMGKVKRKF